MSIGDECHCGYVRRPSGGSNFNVVARIQRGHVRNRNQRSSRCVWWNKKATVRGGNVDTVNANPGVRIGWLSIHVSNLNGCDDFVDTLFLNYNLSPAIREMCAELNIGGVEIENRCLSVQNIKRCRKTITRCDVCTERHWTCRTKRTCESRRPCWACWTRLAAETAIW